MIGNYKVSKGDTVNASFICSNHNPKFYKEPFKFDINRWKNNKSNDAFLFSPFSQGPRNCIG